MPKSFDLSCGFARLIARHPELRNQKNVVKAASEQSRMHDQLALAEELILRPELTLSSITCFRPVILHVVSRIVKRRLSSDSPPDGARDERVAVALSLALQLTPHILRLVLEYFAVVPPPFQSVRANDAARESKTKGAVPLLDLARASYRFLSASLEFRGLWNWSPMFDLLSDREAGVRWCALRCISVIFDLGDGDAARVAAQVLSREEELACAMEWDRLGDRNAVEEAGMYLLPPGEGAVDDAMDAEGPGAGGRSRRTAPPAASAGEGHVSVCGVDLPRRAETAAPGTLVRTGSMLRNLRAVVLALCQGRPVLLEGPPGSGKSALFQELAHITGNTDAVQLHLDDQMDSKTLLGSYACTAVAGEFKWQPGALTQAVSQGRWVLFEDINWAPQEVLASLLPLLGERRLYLPGRGESLAAARGFHLFASITTLPGGATPGGAAARDMLGALWTRVAIEPPSGDELGAIVSALFPALQPLVPSMLATLTRAQVRSGQAAAPDGALAVSSRISVGRQFTIRELLRWARRLSRVQAKEMVRVRVGAPIPASAREAAAWEAADLFTAMVPSAAARRELLAEVAVVWGLTGDVCREWAERVERLHKPAMQRGGGQLVVGRTALPLAGAAARAPGGGDDAGGFARTGHAMRLMERVAVAMAMVEPVLLVGETGTGKTSLVQQLAKSCGQKLVVVNMSQQSDSADLLGGFKPVEARDVCVPLLEVFQELFQATFPKDANSAFLDRVHQYLQRRKWAALLKAFKAAAIKAKAACAAAGEDTSGGEAGAAARSPKRHKGGPAPGALWPRWEKLGADAERAEAQLAKAQGAFAFAFVEGALVRAIREGHWILLDEINLAPAETLERVVGVLEGDDGSVCITERGDVEAVPRHPDFRLVGCMNPATDVGKKDLPMALKQRFTEVYVAEAIAREDLAPVVAGYLQRVPGAPVDAVVDFYLAAREEAQHSLLDGAMQKPQYSLRTLCRALEYTRAALPIYGLLRGLYDGFAMSFLTLLQRQCFPVMEKLLSKHLLQGAAPKTLMRAPAEPASGEHVLFQQFWVERGEHAVIEAKGYVRTASVSEHLLNLARAVQVRRYPILLQGPTSAGKTSLVQHLAECTGHRFMRINNHEHTELQEYVGSYVADSAGKLSFQEGALVQAVRRGYWIVLDELNLAPTDVLEALNRLLDDNRELFVPELQEAIKPHPHFMLFATQNPPGVYGGRKVLSKAFRNRFLELHVDDIPHEELTVILNKRCEIPPSYCKKLVEVMQELQRVRQGSNVFAGKHGFITPRDLFRWAERRANGYQELAEDGYMILAERLRSEDEKEVVRVTLEKLLKAKIDPTEVYGREGEAPFEALQAALPGAEAGVAAALAGVVWSKSMRRLYTLVRRCIDAREPVLLVGDTGSGKTTICQLLALLRGQHLHILNCHQHTETSDFLGGYRPSRDRQRKAAHFAGLARALSEDPAFAACLAAPLQCDSVDVQQVAAEAERAAKLAEKRAAGGEELPGGGGAAVAVRSKVDELAAAAADAGAPFAWVDGPLITAMRQGDLILVDELSLAEDAVLERLNSVLESGRQITLAEKGGSVVEEIVGAEGFLLLATMNPGGDYGKKELSPALRNRFTEIWVPSLSDPEELRQILEMRLSEPERPLATPLLDFWAHFQAKAGQSKALSVRDLLAWATFINQAAGDLGSVPAYLHGAHLVLLDGVGLGVGVPVAVAAAVRKECERFLLTQIGPEHHPMAAAAAGRGAIEAPDIAHGEGADDMDEGGGGGGEDRFQVAAFSIPRGPAGRRGAEFELRAPTTARNAMRVLRALQLPKPVLLEGSPGVGKSSLVSALAKAAGHHLVRINLSEQTDMMDLLGADLPSEGGAPGDFRWSDGVLLRAIKHGSWVLLDELNLASQSILEGLNAILDHRAEVFIPELGQVFKCPPTFRVFSAQNPLQEGGGRKGLPKSFLNRFTQVHVELLQEEDLLFILQALHPRVPTPALGRMVAVNAALHDAAMVKRTLAQAGAPWEFNLRDLMRWCELAEDAVAPAPGSAASQEVRAADGGAVARQVVRFAPLLYIQRMRTREDRVKVGALLEELLGESCPGPTAPVVALAPGGWAQIGGALLPRGPAGPAAPPPEGEPALRLLAAQGGALESLALCTQRGWMSILVGGAASGKTSLVRALAAICGRHLHEYALTSGTDTSELLGSIEQLEPVRRRNRLEARVRALLAGVVRGLLGGSEGGATLPLARRTELLRAAHAAWAVYERHPEGPGGAELLAQAIDAANTASREGRCPPPEGDLAPASLVEELQAVVADGGFGGGAAGSSGRFEWVDGMLLRAMEEGEWVVLDNANFCNPTVLDRLNPLLEKGGELLLNECGLVDGEERVVRAHPDFRLFLLMDPRHGEVSRAMRNRGVELCLLPPEDAAGERDGAELLAAQGVPGRALAVAMGAAHGAVARAANEIRSRPPGARELVRWAGLMRCLLHRGEAYGPTLHAAWDQSVVRALPTPELREAAEEAFRAHCEEADPAGRGSVDPMLSVLPPPLVDMAGASLAGVVRRDAAPLRRAAATALAASAARGWRGAAVAGAAPDASLRAAPGSAAWLPGSLLRAFHGIVDGAEVPELEEGAGEGEELRAVWHAAECFVERATEADADLRAQWLDGLAGDAEGAAAAGVASVLRGAAAVLRATLAHPAAAALAASRGLIADGGAAGRAQLSILPLDVRLAAAVAEPASGSGPRAAWDDAAALSDLCRAVRLALRCAWELKEAEAGADGAVAAGAATALQLSFWRYSRPAERARSAAPSPGLDWLHPVLAAAARAVEGLLAAAGAGEWRAWAAAAVSEMQEWWQAVWAQCRASGSVVDTEHLAFASLRLQRAGARAAAACPPPPSGGGDSPAGRLAELQHVGAQLTLSLGLPANPPDKPLLWLHGGKPALPRTLDLCDHELAVRALCRRAAIPSDGFPGAAAEAAGAEEDLRGALLQGLCLLVHIAAEGGGKGEGSIASIATLLKARIDDLAKAAEERPSGHPGIEWAKWGDIPLAGGDLPRLLPPELLRWEDARPLQEQLLALQQLRSLRLQHDVLGDVMAAGGAAGAAGVEHVIPRLRAVQRHALGCTARSPADMAPVQQLVWLAEAAAAGGVAARDGALAGLVHEMWCTWHAALWGSVLSLGPEEILHRARKGKDADEAAGPLDTPWRAAEGAPVLAGGAESALLVSLSHGPPVPVHARSAKLLQLKLGARHLLTAGAPEGPAALAARDWRHVASLTSAVLEAHAPSLSEDAAVRLRALLARLVERVGGEGAKSPPDADAIASVLATSNHIKLRSLVKPVALPLLAALARAPEVTTLPASGIDPASKSQLKLDHAQRRLAEEVVPETVARAAAAQVVGMAPAPELAAGAAEAARALASDAAALEESLVPRPKPPQYSALCDEARRFSDGLASAARVVALADALAAGGARAAKAQGEAAVWQSNSARLVSRLEETYPHYRDIVQPVQLAVYEIKYGLSLLAAQATKRPADGACSLLPAAIGALMSFPMRAPESGAVACVPGAPGAAPSKKKKKKNEPSGPACHGVHPLPSGRLADRDVHTAIVTAVKEHFARRRGATGAGPSEASIQAATWDIRLGALQASLEHTTLLVGHERVLAAARWEGLEGVFGSLVRVWGEVKDEEERLAAEEDEMYKHKVKTLDTMTEDEEDDATYKERFPEQHGFWKDLAALEDDPVLQEEEEAREAAMDAAEAAGAGADVDAGPAARSAATARLLGGSLLHAIVDAHRAIFPSLAGRAPLAPTRTNPPAAAAATGGRWRASFMSRYEVGVQLVKSLAYRLPGEVDSATAGGHLLRLALEHADLTYLSTTTAAPAPAADGKAPEQARGRRGYSKFRERNEVVVDIHNGENPGEVALMHAPIAATRLRLLEILEEWPENPILLQLVAICDRVQSLPLRAPLKQALTGVELLLARAETWESTAARHVSISEHLKQVAALAQRWRQLELSSWPLLLERVEKDHALCAHKSWFSLYRLLCCGLQEQSAALAELSKRGEGDDDVAEQAAAEEEGLNKEIATSLEQFIQSSTIGEYEERLELLWSFHCQLALEAASGRGGGRRATLAAVLYNTFRYYEQFLPAVKKACADARGPLEKELRDQVKLAKWEDRGYYAQRASAERSQRQLHKYCCKFERLLREPAAQQFAYAANKIGFGELAPEAHGMEMDFLDKKAAAEAAAKAEIVAKAEAKRKARKGAKDAPPAPAAPASARDAKRSWDAFCGPLVALAGASGHALAGGPWLREAFRFGDSALWMNRLPRLAPRLSSVLATHLLPQAGGGAEAAHLDGLGVLVAARSRALRESEKATKPQKKLALAGLLKALHGLGVARRRNAVPDSERAVHAWFQQPAPPVASALAARGPAAPALVAAAGLGEAWGDCDSYFYRLLARVQRLREARRGFSKELSLAEADKAVNSVEHLVMMVREQRAAVAAWCGDHSRLCQLTSQLQGLAGGGDVVIGGGGGGGGAAIGPPLAQAVARGWMWQFKRTLDEVSLFLDDTHELVQAALAVEVAPTLAASLVAASAAVQEAAGLLAPHKEAIDDALAPGLGDSAAWPPLVGAGDMAAVEEGYAAVAAVRDLLVAAGRGAGGTPVPTWPALVAAASAAAEEGADLSAALCTGGVQPAAAAATAAPTAPVKAAAAAFSAAYEAAVGAVLVWAQALERPAAPAPAPAPDAPKEDVEPKAKVEGEAEGEAEGGDEDDPTAHIELPDVEGTVVEWSGKMRDDVASPRMSRLVEALGELLARGGAVLDLAAAPGGADAAAAAAALAARLRGMLDMVAGAHVLVLARHAPLHRAQGKLAYVLCCVFVGLFQEGFCAPAEEGEGGEGGGSGKFEDDVEGTGMGEGEGKKDVSDQIEDEDQLLGAQRKEDQDKEKEKPPAGPEDNEVPQGVEMDNDFDGDMHDIDEDAERESDEEEPEEGDEERLDQEMGDVDNEDDVVDERMWNEEDEKDTKESEQKKEKGGAVDASGQETEMDAKDSDDEGGDDDKGGKDDKKDDKGGKEDKPPEAKPAEEEESDAEEQVNEGGKAEENHDMMTAPEEDLQLPDDMQLDEGEEDAGGEEGEGEDAPPPGGDEAPDMGGAEKGAEEDGGEGEEEVPGGDGGEEDTEPKCKDEEGGGGDGQEEEEEEGEGEDEEDGGDEDNGVDARGRPDDAGDEEDVQAFGGGGGGAAGDTDPSAADAAGGDPRDAKDQSAGRRQAPKPTPKEDPAGEEDEEKKEGGEEGGEKEEAAEGAPEPPSQGDQQGAATADGGAQGSVAPGAGPEQPDSAPTARPDPNPFRSLGDAMQRFRDRVKVVGDEAEGERPEQEGGEGGGGEDAPEDQEFQFQRDRGDEDGQQGGAQALAPATEEQAAALDALPDKDEEAGEDGDAAKQGDDMQVDGQADEGPDEAEGVTGSASTKKWKAGQTAGLDEDQDGADEGEAAGGAEDMDAEGAEGEGEGGEGERPLDDSYISLAVDLGAGLQAGEDEEPAEELSPEEQARLREEIRARMLVNKGGEEGEGEDAAARAARARALWPRFEALTAQLAQELAEQLRLILEPSLASKLQGDFRTGKRINMKKVIPYIASHFRKDKIWMRRTKPDKRRYQVLLCVDDSRSMAENACGQFALESLTLISRAMSRLEVGELGVVSFGETGRARSLHDLDQPFSDQAAMDLLGQMAFDQDNTIADRPMVELLDYLRGVLDEGRQRASGGHERLQQLVLILADGRFHEKEPLRRAVRDMAEQAGLLVVFLVLDNPKSSLLDMQSVSFAGGKPTFTKYLDTFPFPYYILLKDTAALPRTLADLLRQWFELTSNTGG